jgi:hypothetical protein
MALKKPVVTSSDISVSDAYFKIVTTVVEWTTNKVTLILGVWKSKAACNNGKRQIMIDEPLAYVLDIPPGSEGGTKADQYLMLKMMVPFFADAEDAT